MLAVPDFLWGLLLILVFGVLIPILPITGRIDPMLTFEPRTGFYLLESVLCGEWTASLDLVRHLLLPTLALALPLMAALARVLKNSLLEVMQQDYVMLARVKGYSRSRILWRVALRNAAIPALTLAGTGTVQGKTTLSGLVIAAVVQRDLPLIQGLVLTFAVLFIATNLLVDLAYTLVNPRVRQT